MLFITEDGDLLEGTLVSDADSKLLKDVKDIFTEEIYGEDSGITRASLNLIQKYNFTLKTAKKPTTTRKK